MRVVEVEYWCCEALEFVGGFVWDIDDASVGEVEDPACVCEGEGLLLLARVVCGCSDGEAYSRRRAEEVLFAR